MLDPGLRSPGVALFVDGCLRACARVGIAAATHSLPAGERVQRVASRCLDWFYHLGSDRPDEIIFEWPQIYRASKSKGDPNDLIPLAGIGSAFVAMNSRAGTPMIRTPLPAEWCGQLPKATRGNALDSPRARAILSCLSAEEREQVLAQHDAIDAVGLGLWAAGRFPPRRLASGARPG